MTAQADFVRPPCVATWLVNLFTLPEEESIIGDLLEEYSHFSSRLGIPGARRWYWRQTVKTIAHLFAASFRVAPLATAAAVVGGFLGHVILSGLPDKLLSAITDRYLGYWQTHFAAYVFWATDGMLFAHLILSIIVGCIVALAAKGREVVATMTLALVLCGLIGSALVWIAMHRPIDVAWMLWQWADPFAIVVGGAIVRTRRITRGHSDSESLA
jgi:hypothetical protein